MFGNFNLEQTNRTVTGVEYRLQDEARYTSANNDQRVIIDTALGRAYINSDSCFTGVPESVWNAAFQGEPSPKQFLEEKIGTDITDDSIKELQSLLDDLITAEFKSKKQ